MTSQDRDDTTLEDVEFAGNTYVDRTGRVWFPVKRPPLGNMLTCSASTLLSYYILGWWRGWGPASEYPDIPPLPEGCATADGRLWDWISPKSQTTGGADGVARS